ncbi:GNAT family N-acetyltransferase [Sinomonas halotolerans]|uniref:GNAT family N-acetyltransferase n=1 Tax=Sinomonas halotolerans TaxID=1644133 RepID=A0ABU9WUX5_9MICC
MLTLNDVWPLFGLRLGTPRLVLRPLRDDDLPALAEAVLSGIHDPARMPFAVPWTGAPPGELAANTARWVWGRRSEVGADAWTVQFGIFAHDGAMLGAQDISASRFADRRTVETGSWLRRDEQGRGYGLEARATKEAFRRPGWELEVGGGPQAAAFLGVGS